MRQIHFCAWLMVMSLAAAACGGAEFSSSERNSAGSQPPEDTLTAGTSDGDQAGASSSSGGTGQVSIAGKSSGGGAYGRGGAGGGTSSGGMSSAGSSPTGGTGPGGTDDCASGSITFRMLPGPELSHDFLCDAGCGTGWLTITDAEGAMAFSLFSACGIASCESCEMLPCAAAACLPTALTAEGSELVWTGTYLAKDTCGENLTCQRQTCVKPGKYKAKACAAINGGTSGTSGACMPKNEQLCAEAEFEFPAATSVKLVLNKP